MPLKGLSHEIDFENVDKNGQIFALTLFYTRGLGIVVLYVMVLQPYGFSLGFFT